LSKEDRKPIAIGITGTIGSGKSAVGSILLELGVPVIDSDKIVHTLLNTNIEVQRLVTDRFGKSLLIESSAGEKQIDRKALAAVIFNDASARRDLELILHPRVRQESRKMVADFATQGATAVGALVPLLFEANLKSEYDEVWAVVTDDVKLRERLKLRDGLSDAEVERRLQAQLSQKAKADQADRIIDNSGDLTHTRHQVEENLNALIVQHHSNSRNSETV
jgi:dephospho-CoA kinase